MAWFDDITELNPADDTGEWDGTTGGGSSGFDSPTLNDSVHTTPIYIESTSCLWWPFKKDITDGYTYTDVIPASVSMTGRILVGFINYPFADLDNIPVTSIYMRMSSATTFTTNYAQWDAKAQILSPENTPISGHTPVIGYPDAATETGTPNYGSVESVGWVATSGGTNDGKQGGFDWFFVISYVGAHSATLSGTYFSGLYSEYFDNEGQGLPGETNRPIGVLSKSGNSYTTNVNFRLGHGTSDTANLVVTETGKVINFNNLHLNHELGYEFIDPASTHEVRLTLTDCSHFWNDQASTSEIFTNASNATYFKLDGCSFSKGGKITLPPDSANRWVRTTKFSGCQTGTATNGEFTDCTLASCYAMTVSGDADFTGTQVLTPAVAADGSGLIWTGNYDPDGNLDGMSFSKGTNAHHAIEFGTATPTTMTLRNIAFSGFSATDAANDSTLYVRRTSGTVTINLIGCSGNISYKSSGATVNLVISPVTTEVHVDDHLGASLQNANVYLRAADGTGPLPYQDSVTISRTGTTATVTHTAHGMNSNEYIKLAGITDKTEDNNGAHQITVTGANSYTYTTTDSGSTSYTGSITATGVLLYGLTDINGDISISRTFGSNQPVAGFVRKSSASPRYKTFNLAGNTVDSTNGLTINVRMILDE